MPHIQKTSVIFIVNFTLSWHKSGVLKDLTKDLKKIGITKNKWKKLYDVVIYKT